LNQLLDHLRGFDGAVLVPANGLRSISENERACTTFFRRRVLSPPFSSF
jgi:hypothetical protein